MAGSEGSGERLVDPAAQLERTSLSWSRTAFSVAACGALLVRQGLVDDLVPVVVIGGLTLAASVAIWLLAATRYTQKRATGARHLLVGHAYAVRSVTVLTAVVSCAAASVAMLWLLR